MEEQLAAFAQAADTDLRTHGTTSDAETIRDTAVAQPLIVSTSLIALRAVLAGSPATTVVDVTAGHSVGELTAAAVAGVLTDAGAVGLVGHRARAMAAAAGATPTGMSAVVGGDLQDVLGAIEAADLHPANVNGGGQVVAAGDLEALARLTQTPPARSRVVPLQVAGAFHTPYMEPARAVFGAVAEEWACSAPETLLLSNADGAAYATGTDPGQGRAHGNGRDVLRRLATQIVAPVRWDLCQETLLALGVTGMVELAPAGVLTGLARRTLPGVETVAVKSPADLDAARDLVRRHTGHGAASANEREATP